MLSKAVWLEQSTETRRKIAAFLGLSKSGGVEVAYNGQNGVVISDGYTSNDLAKVDIKTLQQELGLDWDDFYKLFYELVRRVELPVVEIAVEPPQEPNLAPSKPKEGELTSLLSEAEKRATSVEIDGKTYVKDPKYQETVFVPKNKGGRPKKK